MQHITARIVVAVSVLVLAASSAQAERPRGTFRWTDEAPAVLGGSAGYRTIFLNRYGGTYTPSGYNDAVNNRSTIVDFTSSIPAFSGTDAEWNELEACVRYQFAPFDVEIVTTDPSPAAHIEAVVGGSPSNIGESGIGGVAPFTCSPLNSPIVFNFSEVYAGNMEQLCFTVAQEVAHAYGLDHEFMCEDNMTYLSGCGFKTFVNTAAPCGEFEARSCYCGGSTQNSHQRLTSYLGTRPDNAAPNVQIVSPAADGYPTPGFRVEITATDDSAIEKVEAYLDGNKIGESQFGPYSFPTLPNIGLGAHTIEARAIDFFGKQSTTSISIVLTADGNPPQCEQDDDCPGDQICYQLRCFEESGLVPLGGTCQNNNECDSGMCAMSGNDSLCTQPCSGADSCPDGFDCVDASSGSVCWPSGGASGSGSGGCRASGGDAGAMWLLVGLMLLAVVSRRRSHA